jgi:flagellar hook-basal body complex protein FliE
MKAHGSGEPCHLKTKAHGSGESCGLKTGEWCMADQVGKVGTGLNPLTGVGGVQGVGGQGSAAAGGASFKDSLVKNLEKLNEAQQEATAAVEDLAAGRRGDVENVLLATQKADQAFRMALAVRNKVQAAFDELKQVRI